VDDESSRHKEIDDIGHEENAYPIHYKAENTEGNNIDGKGDDLDDRANKHIYECDDDTHHDRHRIILDVHRKYGRE
jgi:hypothetical protein